jgi:ethanolamine ammonia-lyase small subunit
VTDEPAPPSPWPALRQLTAARIGLERSGASLATRPLLEFRLAHARARDAVQTPLDPEALAAALPVASVTVDSACPDQPSYLRRPDLGRRLGPQAAPLLAPHAGSYDLAVAVADGLSSRAVQENAAPLLALMLPRLQAAGWRIAPVVIVRHGRVAIGDAIATALGAEAVLVLIGERPGLSAPNSMGAYFTWQPGPGTTDADRNCVSNIRPEGLPPEQAAARVVFLLSEMRSRRLSGTGLKDEWTPLIG